MRTFSNIGSPRIDNRLARALRERAARARQRTVAGAAVFRAAEREGGLCTLHAMIAPLTTDRRAYRWFVPALGAAACLAAVCGCGGAAHPSEREKVEAVVDRWLAAEHSGDGATWCDQLSRARLAREEENITKATGHAYSCARMHTGRPPGVSNPELYVRARRELTEGFRVESATIAGAKASVAYSWLASKQTNPLLGYIGDTRRGDRWEATVSLVREGENWKIGRR
jgi:hypothetical protein